MITRVKNIFRYNLPVKAAALAVAVVLWLVIMAEQNPVIEGNFEVPIIVNNAPRGYKLTTSQTTAQISVQGLRSHLISAEAANFQAFVNLDELTEGVHSVEVMTNIPQNFELTELKPDHLKVTLDPYADRQIPAELIVTGQTAPNTTIAKVEKNIEIVTVSGPKSKVDTVTRVVGYVGLSGNSEDFSLNAPITAINADGREVSEVRVLPSSIIVSVQLARGLTRKIVNVIPILDNDLPAGYGAKITKVSPQKIEIAGESSVINSLDSVKTEKISLKDTTSNTSKMLRLALPAGVTVTDAVVAVEIEVFPTAKNEESSDDDKNNQPTNPD